MEDSIVLWRAAAMTGQSWLAHGVTERGGGVSAGPYASLNLGLSVGDAASAVIENRRRAAAALGFGLDCLICAAQVHGGGVTVVGEAQAGRGARDHGDALPGADALVTDTPGLLLGLCFADCVPVLLADPARRVVAVAHAGWRGLAAGVLPHTVTAMTDAFGSRPGDLVAAIGPCIGPCCYEVGDEVAAHFDPEDRTFPSERPHLDLRRAAARHLTGSGLRATAITIAPDCTFCRSERYFSHRRDGGRTGRIGAFIGIVEKLTPVFFSCHIRGRPGEVAPLPTTRSAPASSP